MPYKPLQLGSATASSEAVQQSLKKINEMLAELYATDPTLFDWNNFDQSIIPSTTDTRDLGSPTKRWRSIYVSGNSLHIGDAVLSVDQTGKLLIDGASISGDYNDLDNLPVLALVATSGNYNDLTNKPIIPDLTGYATENFVTTRGYITSSALTGYATQTFVNNQITTVVGAAPAALNTLAELAAALNNDQDYAASITTQLSLKANISSLSAVATSGSYNDLTNKPNLAQYLTTETDPTVAGHIKSITPQNISNWNTAYGWGNHALAGYLTSVIETDTLNSVIARGNATTSSAIIPFYYANQAAFPNPVTYHGAIAHSHADGAMYFAHGGVWNKLANDSLLANKTNWDTAYSWGNHASAGYLTSYTETDPTVAGHIKSITTQNISKWEEAHAWGDHSLEGYLTSYTETDPVFAASAAGSITSTQVTNWNTAYEWGNHASAGYLTTASSINSLSDVDVTTNPPQVNQVLKWNGTNWVPAADATAGGGGLDADTLDGQDGTFYLNYTNLTNKPTDLLVDGDFTSPGIMLRGSTSGSYSILVDSSTNWNTAYSWGDHTLAGYAIASSLSAVASTGNYNDLTNKPTLFSGSYNDLTNKPTLFSGSYNDLTNKPTLFSGSYNDLTNKPTIPADISDLTDINDLLGTASTGNVTFSGNTINVSNANPLTITPVLTLSNNLNATNINLTGTITSQASGTPEIVSDNEILLDAGTRVELVGSPIKMANFTSTQRDALLAENGDVIYNSSTNKFQGYANGVWVDLH